MKKKIFGLFGRSMALQIVLLAALAIFAVSCEKDATLTGADKKSAELENADGADMRKGSSNAPGMTSIAQIAIDNDFDELVAALSYVDQELNIGLVDLFMNGTTQYTVFAPTDLAFQNLYTTLNVTEISDLPATLVLDVLLYHVVEGRRASNSVVPPVRPRSITTLLGVQFSVSAAGVISAVGNTANITSADISASNGVIHVIDEVILPITI